MVINDGNDATVKAKRAGERITEFMKTSKVCSTTANQPCFKSGAAKLFPSSEGEYSDYGYGSAGTGYYRIITADGTSLGISNSEIVVDIDGPSKGAYQLGSDVFFFDINLTKGIVPRHFDLDFSLLVGQLYGKGDGAAAWIIKYDNADYLKFKNGSGLCPNGTTVTEANPRCK